jgi:hypothetical protein
VNVVIDEAKRCARCARTLARDQFYPDKKAKDRLTGYCRSCARHYSEERRRSNGAKPRPTRQPLQPGQTKECRRCHQVLDVMEFYPSKQNADGRYSYCKTCDTERVMAWKATHPERWNAIQQRYLARKRGE